MFWFEEHHHAVVAAARREVKPHHISVLGPELGGELVQSLRVLREGKQVAQEWPGWRGRNLLEIFHGLSCGGQTWF